MRATVQHFEIPVDDLDRAAAFYRRIFGWEIRRLSWEGPAYCTVRAARSSEPSLRPSLSEPARSSEGVGGGLMAREELGADHPLLVVHIEGASLDQVLERIEEAGGEVVQPPRPVGEMGEWARFRDSEGNLLGLWRDPE